MNKVLETIKNRRSIRQYSSKQIKEEELDAILEAAIYAPSAVNQQPWYFTIIQNQEMIEFINTIAKKNMTKDSSERVKNRGMNENFHTFYHAPTVIMVSGKKDWQYSFTDCCAAIENMLLAAESLGIGSCWIGFIRYFLQDKEAVKKLNIPAEFEPYYAVCLGYKASKDPIKATERNKNVFHFIK